jgi:hypothetical protein
MSFFTARILSTIAISYCHINRRFRLSKKFSVRRVEKVRELADISRRSDFDTQEFEFHFDSDSSSLRKVFPIRQVFEIAEVSLDLKTGMMFTKKGTYLLESSNWPSSSVVTNYIPTITRSQKVGSKIQKMAIIPSNGFYHWLIEDLPSAIGLIQSEESSKLVVWESCPSYVKDFIRISGIEAISAPRFSRVRNLRFVEKVQNTGWPDPRDLEILRRYFERYIGKETGKNVYISRLNSSRSPKFEQELVDVLSARGWEILNLEGIPLDEQIGLISSASKILGVHGAGLSGIVWASPNTKVIELMPFNRKIDCIYNLAQVREQSYKRFYFDPEDTFLPTELFDIL